MLEMQLAIHRPGRCGVALVATEKRQGGRVRQRGASRLRMASNAVPATAVPLGRAARRSLPLPASSPFALPRGTRNHGRCAAGLALCSTSALLLLHLPRARALATSMIVWCVAGQLAARRARQSARHALPVVHPACTPPSAQQTHLSCSSAALTGQSRPRSHAAAPACVAARSVHVAATPCTASHGPHACVQPRTRARRARPRPRPRR